MTEAEWEGKLSNSIHRITQLVIHGWMDADSKADFVGVVVVILKIQFSGNPRYEVDKWPLYRRLLPHARVLTAFTSQAEGECAKILGALLNQVALFLMSTTKDYLLALKIYQDNLQLIEQVYGTESHHTAVTVGSIANIQSSLGRDAEGEVAEKYDKAAQDNFEKSIAIDTILQNFDGVAYKRNNLAEFHRERERFTEAHTQFAKTLLLIRKFAPDNPLRGATYGNIGLLFRSWGEAVTGEIQKKYRKRALDYQEKALSFTRVAVGEVNFDTAISYYNLSFVYTDVSDWDKQIKYAIRPFVIGQIMLAQEIIKDPKLPNLLDYEQQLANVLEQQNRDPEDVKRMIEAEIPIILKEHAEWKARKGAEKAAQKDNAQDD